MLSIQSQENDNNANTTTNSVGARSPFSAHRPPHSQCHYANTEHSSPTTTSSHIRQQPATFRLSSSPPPTMTNTPTPRNYNHNHSLQHRRQRRISATFGGPGSVIGGGSGSEESSSSASSPSPSSSASSPSYSTSSYFQPATPSPTATSSRRLSPLLESSSTTTSAHPFPYAQSPTLLPAGSLLFTPVSSSSSPVPPTSSTTSTMTNTEGMATAITTTGGRRDSRAEPYYLPLERPMHPFDSLPPPSPSPLSSSFNAATTASPQLPLTSRRAHKLNTFGIGPVFGPFPASPSSTTTTFQQTENEGATNIEGDVVEYSDCGSGSGNGGGNVSRRGGGGRGSTRLRMSMMSTSSGSIPEERQEEGEEHEASPYIRPTGGRARSTFGYDDHHHHYHHYYPLSPISPLALSALPSPTAAATPTSSTTESSAHQLERRLLQQQQLQQQPRVVDDRQHLHHAPSPSLPPLPLSSAVHPPRIITTALYVPHFAPSSSSMSPASATTTLASPYPLMAAVSSSSSPSIYAHTPLSPPTSSTSSSSSISAFAIERGGINYNNSTTAHHLRNGGERNLLFPSSTSLSLGLGIRLGGDTNNSDRAASQKKTKKDEKNAISPSLLSASPSPTSLPRPLSPPLPPFPSLPPPMPTDHLQIDHLHYYQQGLLHRRNSARTRVPLSTYDFPNDNEYPIGGGGGGGGRFTFDDDLASTSTTNAVSSPTQRPLTPPPRSSSLSRPKRRLSAFAKRIFTRSPPTPSPSPSSPSSSPAVTASNTAALVSALTKSSSTVSVNAAVSPIETTSSTHLDLPAPVTAVTPSSYHDQHQPHYQHHAYTTSHPPLTTFTTLSSHDISKPITKYPFGIPHDHSKTNPEEDDEDEDEYEVVEDISLYTLTHLHPMTFVPTQSASSIGAGAGTGAGTGVAGAHNLPSSQESLTIIPSFSSFHLPQSHRDMQAQSKSTASEDVLRAVPMLPQHHRDPIDSLSEEEEDEASKQQPTTKKKKCASLTIFRFFLKK